MSLIMREKAFYKSLAVIVIPIVLQNVVSYATNLLDTLMLGSLGQDALSAAALASQPFFILTLMTFGLSGGASVLISQYWGKRDIKAVNQAMGLAAIGAATLSAVFMILCVGFPRLVMGIYSGEEHLIGLGAQYLRIVGISYVFYCVSATLLLCLRCVEQVMLSFVVSLVGLVVNLFLNWCLIFGNFGFPRLEMRGAALATLVARLTEFAIVCVYLLFIDKRLKLRARDFFSVHLPMLREFVRYSIPVLVSETLWGLGTSVHSMVIGHMGEDSVAAFSVGDMFNRLVYIAIMGLSGAALVMIGKQLGAGHLREARACSNTLTLMCAGFGLLGSGVMLLLRGQFIGMYTLTPEAHENAMRIMITMAAYLVIKSINTPLIVGALRAGGDTRFAMVIDVIFLWTVGIPMGIVAAFAWGFPVYIVYAFLLLDEFIKMFIVLWRYFTGKWVRNITKEGIADNTA